MKKEFEIENDKLTASVHAFIKELKESVLGGMKISYKDFIAGENAVTFSYGEEGSEVNIPAARDKFIDEISEVYAIREIIFYRVEDAVPFLHTFTLEDNIFIRSVLIAKNPFIPSFLYSTNFPYQYLINAAYTLITKDETKDQHKVSTSPTIQSGANI